MISYVATRSTCVFYNLPGFSNAQWMTFLKRLSRLSCSQCILQCTYSAGNNWSVCTNDTGGLGFWRTSRDIQATADSIFVCGVLLIFSFRAKYRVNVSRPSAPDVIQPNQWDSCCPWAKCGPCGHGTMTPSALSSVYF